MTARLRRQDCRIFARFDWQAEGGTAAMVEE